MHLGTMQLVQNSNVIAVGGPRPAVQFPLCSQLCSLQQKSFLGLRVVGTQRAKGTQTASAQTVCSTNVQSPAVQSLDEDGPRKTGPRVLIAGGGIGGLVLAVGLLRRGYDVQVFERDLTAIRGEGKYRGPIQIQSNALAALEAIDPAVAEQVLEAGCITGDRVNGLCDGLTGDWYVKFDTFHPAVERGLPVTRVVGRTQLQEILAASARKYGGEDVILNDMQVVDYEEGTDASGRRKVWAVMADGSRWEGDLLIGADGIWSKVRRKLVGDSAPTYSEYTCYTGIADFTPPDIDTVGYRVFLGNRQYFVSSDVGGGRMQWYAFHKEPAGGEDEPGKKKERLLHLFGHWSDNVTDLIKATPEEDVLRRDIYDRPPIFTWTRGRVALLGDSAHAMQPNLGQGGCMAIEDAYQLSCDLDKAVREALESGRDGSDIDVEGLLKGYERKRILRASTIHGLAGMAAIMATTYKAYLGEGLGEVGKALMKLKIPHPGRVGGKVAMDLTMPAVLSWVLGGNTSNLASMDRVAFCRINDKPKAFDEKDFQTFMHNDEALLRAANADWLLVPQGFTFASDSQNYVDTHKWEYPPVEILEEPVYVGRDAECGLVIDSAEVSGRHATLQRIGDDFFIKDLGSPSGTFWNERRLTPNVAQRLNPGDLIEFGSKDGQGQVFTVKMRHVSCRPVTAQDGGRQLVTA